MNGEQIVLSRPFRVRNTDEARRVFEMLGFEVEIDCDDKVVIFSENSYWDDDAVAILDTKIDKYVGGYSTAYQEIGEVFPDFEHDPTRYEEVELEKFVKDIIVDYEVFVLTETYNEGFRYNGAWSIMISNFDTRSVNLNEIIDNNVKSMIEGEKMDVRAN